MVQTEFVTKTKPSVISGIYKKNKNKKNENENINKTNINIDSCKKQIKM